MAKEVGIQASEKGWTMFAWHLQMISSKLPGFQLFYLHLSTYFDFAVIEPVNPLKDDPDWIWFLLGTFHCHVWWNQRLSFFLQPSFSGWKRILMQVWADQVSSKTSWLFGRHNVVYSSDLQSMYVQFTSYCKLEYCMYIMHIKFPNYPRYFIPT